MFSSSMKKLEESTGKTLDQWIAITHRDDFDFRSKWAVTVDEMMRHLVELKPTVILVQMYPGARSLKQV